METGERVPLLVTVAAEKKVCVVVAIVSESVVAEPLSTMIEAGPPGDGVGESEANAAEDVVDETLVPKISDGVEI